MIPWLRTKRYGTERRGIRAWDDDRLRWHPGCPWGQGTAGCLVAPVTCHRTGLTVAVWRILGRALVVDGMPLPPGTYRAVGSLASVPPVDGNAVEIVLTSP